MIESVLTAERILEAAEEVLRRFGPTKASVVDVARALGVSHGSVYRHFPSKAALRDAVLARWLERITAPLAAASHSNAVAPERLRHWFDLLLASKRQRAQADPELFATYVALTAEAPEVIKAHVADLVGQIAAMIAAGVAEGTLQSADPARTAQAVFDATVRFHNPIHATEWPNPHNQAQFEAVWALLMRGLRS
jgi:AcrR family transcriptional regulator